MILSYHPIKLCCSGPTHWVIERVWHHPSECIILAISIETIIVMNIGGRHANGDNSERYSLDLGYWLGLGMTFKFNYTYMYASIICPFILRSPDRKSSWGQHGAQLGSVGPSWALLSEDVLFTCSRRVSRRRVNSQWPLVSPVSALYRALEHQVVLEACSKEL